MATNSELFYKMKNLFNSGFNEIETSAANTAMKIRLHRQLGHFMKPTDTISTEYKREVEE